MKSIFIRLFLFSSVLLAVFLFGTQIAKAENSNIMIISPHEDDETITCGGVIKRAVDNGDNVKILYITEGNFHNDPKERIRKAVNAMNIIGLTKNDIIYLGYGDYSVLANAYNSKKYPQRVFAGPNSTTKTEGFEDVGVIDYHYEKYKQHASYTRENILNDICMAIEQYKPDHIYMPAHMETHKDHAASAHFTTEAILKIKAKSSYSPTIHEYMTYKEGLPQKSIKVEPHNNVEANMDNTPYTWASRESITVPDEMSGSLESGRNLKRKLFDIYKGDCYSRLRFLKSDELFWKKPFSSLSYSAAVTASSESTKDGQSAANAIDGIIKSSLSSNEWVAKDAAKGAWIKLSWKSRIKANRIILYDRPDSEVQVLSGTLIFSDGTYIAVKDALPNYGSGKVIDFDTKTFDSVKFVINTSNGTSVGLAEFEVYDNPID